MEKSLISEFYLNLTNSMIALLFFLAIYFLVSVYITKKLDTTRQRKQFRARLLYILIAILVIIMAKIWIEGLSHLFAILGLVSAALIIISKEVIMNFLSCFLITWRELFTENDLVFIEKHKGYVKTMGPLYFTLNEVCDSNINRLTGKIVKVPNSLVGSNILINLSQNAALLEQSINLVIPNLTNIDQTIETIGQIVNESITAYYKDVNEYSIEYIKKKDKTLAKNITLAPVIEVIPKFEKTVNIELKIQYYCFIKDCFPLKQAIWHELLVENKVLIEG